MANVTLTNLPTVTALNGSEPLLGVQSGSSVQITTGQIASLAVGGGGLPFAVSVGGTGVSTFPVANGIILGNGTSALTQIAAPAGTNYILVGSSGGSYSWQPTIPTTAGVDSISFGTTGLTPSTAQSGIITVAGTLLPSNGGTGITSLGSGIATWLGTPSSANLAAAMTDETGSGILVFNNTPTLITPILGAATATSITSPIIYGGSGAASTLTLQSTSGVGTTDSIFLKVGNNGATTALSITNTGQVTVPFLATSSSISVTPVLSFSASNTSFASGATVSGSYLQTVLQNKSVTAGASTNYVISNDQGTDSSNYGEFGMNSSVFSSGTPSDFFSLNSGIYFSGHDGDITIGSGNGFKTYFAWGSAGGSAHVINASGALGFNTNLAATSGTTGFGTSGQTIISAGNAASPSWGVLGVAGGGTGQSANWTQWGAIYASTTGVLSSTAAGATGQVLIGNTGAAPTWATISTSLVSSISFGTTGLTPNSATTGAVTVAGTLVAANGGTGQNTYAVGDLLYASTTTALSKLAAVATGQVLVSQGTGTAPAYSASPTVTTLNATTVTATAGAGFQNMVVQTTGTGASYTLPAALQVTGAKFKITVVGSGAAGGGTSTTAGQAGGGGGAGAVVVIYLTYVAGQNSITYTVGAAGAAGAVGAAGGNGNLSSAAYNSLTYTAGGGTGGTANGAGGAGGAASGTAGTLSFSGQAGFAGGTMAATSNYIPNGGNPALGWGTGGLQSATAGGGAGSAGTGYGAGGSGARNGTGTTSLAGGAGTAGVVIIEY